MLEVLKLNCNVQAQAIIQLPRLSKALAQERETFRLSSSNMYS